MSRLMFSNRRKTSRYPLNIIGKIIIKVKENYISETVDITNISFDGIQVVFSNNVFLYKYMDLMNKEDSEVALEFEYLDNFYSFENKINWIRIFNYGEQDFYALSGINYKNKKTYEDKLIDLILHLQMQNIYIGHHTEEKEEEKEEIVV